MAVVESIAGTYFPVYGEIDRQCHRWDTNGLMKVGVESRHDLVSRLAPTPPRKPRPAKAGQWGVWVPCKNKANALGFALTIRHRFDLPEGFRPAVKRSAK